jgi:hypothetical protein
MSSELYVVLDGNLVGGLGNCVMALGEEKKKGDLRIRS